MMLWIVRLFGETEAASLPKPNATAGHFFR